MKPRLPIHYFHYGHGSVTVCGVKPHAWWRRDAPRKMPKCGTPYRRITVKLLNVTCEECLSEIIRLANVARAARLRAIGQSKTAAIRRTRQVVPARHARNGLEQLVAAE